MPPTRRKHDPKILSSEAILEDLRFAREELGLDNTGADKVLATLYGLDAEPEQFDEMLPAAREVLRRNADELCNSYALERRNDNRALAAADSLMSLLLDGGIDTKASVVRKKSIERFGCHLTPDGLRKREDQILKLIANGVYDELDERRSIGAPSVTDWIGKLEPIVAPLNSDLRKLLRGFYQAGPDVDRQTMTLARRSLWYLGHVHLMCHFLLGLLQEPRSRSEADLWFAFQAYNVLTLPFERPRDRRMLERTLLQHTEESDDSQPLAARVEGFANLLMERSEGQQLIQRWEVVLRSCPDTCEFERSNDVRQICRPHQLVVALDRLSESINAWRGGLLDALIADRVGSLFDL